MWDERRRAWRALAALLMFACLSQAWAAGARAGALAPAPASELDTWVGEYVFEEDGGRTAGGTPIYVVHQISVAREGDAIKVRLESNGYQTYAAFECAAQASLGRLRLEFTRHADENVFLRGDYRRGDHLLTLVRAGGARRPRLLTYWGKFRPQFRRPRQGRVFFKRQ